MRFYQRVCMGSDVHLAWETINGLQLAPVNSSEEAIKRFQSIARDAFKYEREGYKIIMEHKTSRYPGDLYDMLVLQLTD